MSMKKFTKKMLAIVAAGDMTMGLAMPTSVKPLRQRLERTRHFLLKLNRWEVILRMFLFRILAF